MAGSTTSEEPVAPPPAVKEQQCGCGACLCTMSCADGEAGGPTDWGMMRLIGVLVALIFSLIAFTCNTVDAIYNTYRIFTGPGKTDYIQTYPHGGWTNEDQVLTAGFAFAVSVFLIAMFCLSISPACGVKIMACMPGFCLPSGQNAGGKDKWRTTFSLHTFVAGALHFGYVIMASEKQRTINKILRLKNEALEELNEVQIDSDLPSITIAAIVFAALAAFTLFFVCVISNLHKFDNIGASARLGLKRKLGLLSFILTFVAFVCWVHSKHHHNTVHSLWADKVFIVASCLAVLALLDGFAFGGQRCPADEDFNAILAALLYFVFFIGAAVDIPEREKEPVDIVTIILAAVNSLILVFFVRESKPKWLEFSKMELMMVVIIALAVCQFALSAYEWKDPTGGALHDRRCVLAFGFGAVLVGAMFMFLFDDPITKGLHLAAATVAYIIYFVWECVESTDYFNTFHAQTTALTDIEQQVFRTRTCSLVFAAILCALLCMATFNFCPRRNRVANSTEEAAAVEESAE